MELAYQDKTLPVPERVSDLLARMTLEEKAGQLTQLFYFGDGETELTPESAEPDRLNLGIETAVAAGEIGSLLFVCDPEVANKMQRKAVEETRLGIPLIYGFDVIHGFRTIFPVPIALAASWDPTITERTQQVAAAEARAAGIHWTFAPMCDITFDGRWGRVIEGAGEDPLLGAVIAAAAVRGFQGARVAAEIGPESILAGPKHLVGYGASRGGRDYDDAEISETELRNIYLPPFQAAIGAGAANIMAAYMDLNGVPAAGNHWLLTTLLREELGFEGWVVSDNFGVRNLVTQHWAKDFLDAAARALSAGLDMEMTMFDPAFAHLPDAVRAEHVDPGRLDEAVRRVLTAKFGLGLFDAPYVDATVAPAILSSQGHRTLAQEAAEKSLVLLKNGDDLLPLDLNELRSGGPGSVAVIGQLADSKRDTLGPWVFAQDTAETVTLLAALRDRLGAAVSFAPGAQKVSRVYPPPFDDLDPTVLEPAEDWDDDAAIAEAVALASRARLAIMVVGQRQNQVGEKASVSEIDLPGRQLEQLQRVAATGTPVVLVVLCGRPLDLRWADEHIQAIMLSWYPGSRGGGAVRELSLARCRPPVAFRFPGHAMRVNCR